MILSRDGKPYARPDRVRRLEWLIKRIDKYDLKHYPWGLDRLGNELDNRRMSIADAMKREGLFSERTHKRDLNIHNLIMDAVSAVRNKRYIPDEPAT